MKNRISTSRSFTKPSNNRQNKISQEQKPNINKLVIADKISEIYNYYYSYYFPSILNFSKINYFEKINKSANEAISLIIKNQLNSIAIIDIIDKIKGNIETRYNKDYQIISESYQNYLKKEKKYEYISHFRKHCAKTGAFSMHSCDNRTKGNFILIPGKNPSSSYAICSECKQCFISDFILMLCIPCNKNYYSTLLSEKEDNNIFPATWEKYHCSTMVNEIMKCIKCHNILYLDLTRKKLICKNKTCNFISNPESILWNCSICKEEFHSEAKVYNPLEFQILRKTINIALLLQKKARPKELPCKCEKDLTKLTFFHKVECKGLLYQGLLIDKEVIVCNRCHAINFEEKFNWICPICNIKFYLHNVICTRPFSKKKYIINRELNKSENKSRRNGNKIKNNYIYIKNDNYIEKIINNIRTKNLKKEENLNDSYNKNSLSNLKYNRNNNKVNSEDNSDKKLRHYSTLKEILKQRESSKYRNNNIISKNYDRYNSQEIKNPSIENIKLNCFPINNANSDKINMQNYINSYIRKNRNSISSFSYTDNENKNIKKPIISIESPKIIYKNSSKIKAQNYSTNISTNKTMNSQNSKEKMYYGSNNLKIYVKSSNISDFKSRQRKSYINFNSNNINSFRVSHMKNYQTNITPSYNGIINDFNNSEKLAVNSGNSPLKFSILNQIKNINNFNINININTSIDKHKENNSKNKSQDKNNDFNEKIDEELNDKFEEKTKAQYSKTNLRESLLLKVNDYSSQNIIITKEKLDILSKQTKIPTIQETDYTFINEIGEGTYGSVYLVENNLTSEQYAMKKIICRDYNELTNNKNELELIFSVKHDNILKLLGIQFKYLDETTALIYALMELAYSDWNKEIKRRILAKKYYTENELIHILKQIIKGFLFLQKKNIAHRDIKPQNILLFPSGVCGVAGFGEAKNIKNKTEQSTLRGSELYMSPLLYKGYKYNQKKVVHNPFKSNIFSLGYCFLYAI